MTSELDNLEIATKVMGWDLAVDGMEVYIGKDGDVWPYGEPRWYSKETNRPVIPRYRLPNFVGLIPDAWMVMMRMKELGYWANGTSDWGMNHWNMTFRKNETDVVGTSQWCDTFELAVCKAALAALAPVQT